HTRSKRDWSSDVCSSDLTLGVFVATLGFVISAAYFFVIAPLWKRQLMARLAALEDISAASEQESGMLRGEKLSHAAFLNNLINEIGRASCREIVEITEIH